MNLARCAFVAAGLWLGPFLFDGLSQAPDGSQAVYTDSLQNGWQSYGWATLNYANSTPVHAGAASISVTAGGYQALYLHHAAFDVSAYQSLSFWIHGGAAGGQPLLVRATVNGAAQTVVNLPPLAANSWQQITLSLASLGVANSAGFDGFWIQNQTGNTLPAFYVDDIALFGIPPPSVIRLQIDAAHAVRAVDGRIFGVNTAIWDSRLSSDATASLLGAIGMKTLRYPGGSASDDYEWQTNRSVSNGSFQWASPFPVFAGLTENLGAQAYITVNYGSGTPEQAAAWVAYANAAPASTLSIGADSKGRDWKTAGYWATMRASAPLATDDGYNFLRKSHPAPYGFRYWEIGNECYGSWEADQHGVNGSGLSGAAHDPYTYAQSFAQFREKMRIVDPSIRLGAVVCFGEDSYGNGQHPAPNPNQNNATHTGWTPVVLHHVAQLGALPDFLIYHTYAQEPGAESDAGLLQASKTRATDAANLRQMLTDYVGNPAGAGIELVITEANSVSFSPGKQSVSLVNALFTADILAATAATEFNACQWWDLRNGSLSGNNNASSLYGWRNFGDYGLVAPGDRSDTPADTLYPSYYAYKLLTHWAADRDAVLVASSNYPMLSVHATRRADGSLALLVVNKSPTTDLTGHIELSGFTPGSGAAGVWQYGKTNDLDKADLTAGNFTGAETEFDRTFPAYSMTVIQLPRSSGTFASWQAGKFSPLEMSDPAISGPAADPDRDGIGNLLECAFQLDPKFPNASGLPTISRFLQSGADYLSMTFTRLKSPGNLTYTPEVSGDMIHWNSGAGYTAQMSVADQGSTERVTVRDLTPVSQENPSRFMRLNVSAGP